MTCDSVTQSLALFLYGELSFEEEEAIHQHLEGCQDCRLALERQKSLHTALDGATLEPPATLLADCRRELRLRLANETVKRGVFRRFWEWTGRPVGLGLLRPAGALALVALGFFASRLVPTTQAPDASRRTGPVATQVRYLEPDEAGGVRVVVDEIRQRTLSGTLDDSRIEGLLLQAAQASADPMLRLDSVDYLKSRSKSPEIRKALLRAVRGDNNPVVRLRALEGLEAYGADPEVRSVLSGVLLSDDSVGVRVHAIDMLVRHQHMDMIGTLQELVQKENNDYIRHLSQQTLHAMNASMETF